MNRTGPHLAYRPHCRTAAWSAACICATLAFILAALAPGAAAGPPTGPDGARRAHHGSATGSGTGVWPLAPPDVTRGFDPPAFRYGTGHRGIDLGAAPGRAVHAAAPGTVAFAGQVAGHGVVSVDHRGGLRTTYQPLAPAVSAGDRVAAGTVIGRLAAGHPGCPRAACLHWGLKDGEVYLDPRSLLGTVTVRLVPV